MTKYVSQAVSVMVGTLIYTRFISSAHNFDFPRALFVGFFVAVVSFLIDRFKTKKTNVAA